MLATLPVPAGLRWHEESATAGLLARPRSVGLVHALTALWVAGWYAVARSGLGIHADALALVATAVLVLWALRALTMRTSVWFRDGSFHVRTSMKPWSTLDIPTAELASFELACEPDPTVYACLRSGSRLVVPLDFRRVPERVGRGFRLAKLLPPRPAHAAHVVERLNLMLEAARREGHDTYRT